jgi:hypothetical protein
VNRTIFLVDGFNLYYSLRAASADLGGASTKWLDIRALSTSYLHVIGSEACLEGVYYFTALAWHLDARRPGVTARHRSYIECLKATGVIPVLGRFKFETVRCHRCCVDNPHYEEAELPAEFLRRVRSRRRTRYRHTANPTATYLFPPQRDPTRQ